MKYIQTASNRVLGPKGVVWKCSFEKFKKKFCGTNLCVNYTWGTRFRTAFSAATKYIQTTSNMVLRPKVVVWKCFFEKFKKSFAARTCALVAPGVPIFEPHLVRQRNTSKPPQTWFWDLK